MRYSILFSAGVGGLVFFLAPRIAESWIGDIRTVDALRLFAAFLPCSCLCGVLTGYYTGANRIGTLAAVEVAEQLCSMAMTMGALRFWAGSDPGRACQAVVLGSSAGCCVTLLTLMVLHLAARIPRGEPIPLGHRLIQTALPLALADVVKSGINTGENLMVPKRLALNSTVEDPLAAFGIVGGMVFPVLMFPACILFGLAELLIPELARCAAAGSRRRISHLVRRSLWIAMLYGLTFSGLLFLTARPLCDRLYGIPEAGNALRLYAPLIPMLYCDAITDAMTKGLGQQKICVRYNIFTSAMDVFLLYLLLPRWGMEGYFLSFFITHMVNFVLSLRRLMKITGEKIPLYLPALAASAALGGVWICSFLSRPGLRGAAYLPVFFSLLCLMGVVRREDFRWLKGLVTLSRCPRV